MVLCTCHSDQPSLRARAVQRRLSEGQLWQASMTACSRTPCRSGRIMAVCSWSSVRGPACINSGVCDMQPQLQWSSVVMHLPTSQSGMNAHPTAFVVVNCLASASSLQNYHYLTLLGTPLIDSSPLAAGTSFNCCICAYVSQAILPYIATGVWARLAASHV